MWYVPYLPQLLSVMSTGLRTGHNVVRTIFTTAPQCDEHRAKERA